jgi:hypothetical protein
MIGFVVAVSAPRWPGWDSSAVMIPSVVFAAQYAFLAILRIVRYAASTASAPTVTISPMSKVTW